MSKCETCGQALPNAAAAAPSTETETTPCPKCGGRMWDNRLSKRNPKAPDFKCRDKGCDGVIWPPRNATTQLPAARATVPRDSDFEAFPGGGIDDIPF